MRIGVGLEAHILGSYWMDLMTSPDNGDNKMQSQTADFHPSVATWQTR